MLGQNLTERYADLVRHEKIFTQTDVPALLDDLDHLGARRLCSDPGAFLQRFFEFLVLDVLMDFLHCFEKCRRREPRWWFRDALLHIAIGEMHGITLMDSRKILRFIGICLCALLPLLLIEYLPPILQNDFSTRRKLFRTDTDVDFGREKFLRRIELCDIGTRNKIIKILLHL